MTSRVRVHQPRGCTSNPSRWRPLAVVLWSAWLVASCGGPSAARRQPLAAGTSLATLQQLPLLVAPRTPQPTTPEHVTIAILFTSWCGHCHATLADLASLRAGAEIAVIGLSWSPFEGYDGMGDADRLAAFTATTTPWLPVHALDAATYAALGRPTKVPSLFVFDARGQLVRVFDRAHQGVPTRDELTSAIERAQRP